jgi:dienelactone hydrolase
MGPLPGPNFRVPLEVKVLEEVRLDGPGHGPGHGLLRRKLTYQSDPDDRVPAYLFLPAESVAKKEPAARRPAVLCLHQTTSVGKDEPAGLRGNAEMRYALELAQRGYVTLAPDYPSLGEHTYDFDPRHGYVSGSMKAVWDNIRAVDLLASLPEVDAERIGCLGHSLGGHSAMFTAAFDQRLKAVVSSCGFTRFHKDDVPSWTGPRYMPRIASVYLNDPDRLPFDFTEIVASFAPRAFLACAAQRDDDFDVSGVRDAIASAATVYKLHDRPERLRALYPDSGHAFPKDARQAAYEFFDIMLKKSDEP